MEYYGNKLCISYPEFVDSGIVSVANYKQLAARGRIDVVRHGGGASGCCALIAIDSLPSKYKEAVEKKYPGDDEVRIKAWVLSNYEMDQAAIAFFHDRSKTGIDLDEKKKREYIINASVLNCCIKLYDRARDSQRLFGGKYNWDMMAKTIEILREELGHTLPTSTLRFRKKVNDYKRGGYGCLISGKFGNQSARKVDYKTKQLVRGLAVLPNKPYNSNVHEMYISFVCGELDVYDPKTGELFNPDDFTDKNGDPKSLSDSTINNILNEPATKMLIEKSLSSWSTFMHEQMPYMHRHNGRFSLSQITMDDVDLTRKLKDTKQRVHAYYAYDVVSQCVIGASYARKKDERLVVDCFRDMFRLIARHGWGIPAGIEVENHLMSQYKEGFLKAETVFQFVRFCAPLNSQEKYAEPLNGAKKRSVIHKNHEGIGRFYGKGKWRQEYKKISDETNELYEDKEYFTWEQLVADDRKDNEEWNNTLHPNQKMYPGMTRWQVLEAYINPNLLPYDARTLAYHIGERVETSIRRNSTVRVAHEDWWLSSTSVLERLEPNNYKVTACYLPDDEGTPQEVFIYQKGKYIDTVEKVNTYSRVIAEQTEEDQAAFVEQQKKIAKFNKYVEDNAIDRLGILKPSQQAQQEVQELKPSVPQKCEPRMPLPSASDRAVADI
ncbi:hypothetical protein HMPREF1640_03365 [Prevotella sp. S7-1-8]|uniref:hypothetical protein n=1 Tax=Prevotella sp. S7-1-8 TaxID=1284775 RepID=UPI00050F1B7A|nr:hypothetical protein [Prevotella sp. S7-1-8]KGF18531.1 hypothetical protein HMPREF1640_03365 [Prevotella sp. S7-1-8]